MKAKVLRIEPYLSNDDLRAKIFIDVNGREEVVIAAWKEALDYGLSLKLDQEVEIKKSGNYWNFEIPSDFKPTEDIDILKKTLYNKIKEEPTAGGKIKIKADELEKYANEYFKHHYELFFLAVEAWNSIAPKDCIIEPKLPAESISSLVTSLRLHLQKECEVIV